VERHEYPMRVARSVAIGRNMALRRCKRNINIVLGAMRVSAAETR
jgi:hypothetical protein